MTLRSAVYRVRAGRAAVKTAICLGGAGPIPVRAVGQAWAEVRGELAWRAHGRVPGLAGPLLVRLMGLVGRHLAGASQQLTVVVVVVLDRYRFACSCRLVLFLNEGSVVESVGMAPGQAVRVTAEAGVATFHQIPPGP